MDKKNKKTKADKPPKVKKPRQRLLEFEGDQWFKPDNAALVFIPAHSRTWTAVFRISAVMRERVEPEVLQEALIDVLPRFPTFAVTVKAGLFWYYLETSRKAPLVSEDTNYPCQRMDIKNGRHLIRVLYSGHRIAFESFHSVTDGGGGIIFLNTLVARYLERKGVTIASRKGCFDYRDKPSPEETEDAFSRYASVVKRKGGKLTESKSYQIKLDNCEPGVLNVIHGVFNADKLYSLSKSYGASVGQFLAAVLLKAVADHRNSLPVEVRRKDLRPLKITASVDLRKRFPSQTVRNFATFMNIQAPAGDAQTLEDFVAVAKEGFARLDQASLQERIDTLTGIENKLIVRILPLFIKNIALKLSYSMFGESLSALALSNFGRLEVPDEFFDHVERIETMLGPQKINSLASSCVTYGDKVIMTFSSRAKSTPIERAFFRTLSAAGIDITIDSNF